MKYRSVQLNLILNFSPVIICLGLVCMLLFGSKVFGQSKIEGVVLDGTSSKPMPYCSIQIKGTVKGAITNEDGLFEIEANIEKDTLIISYLGYQSKTIASSFFKEKIKIYMQPELFELSEFTIIEYKDYLYQLINKCSEKTRKTPSFNSKAYFSLETESSDSPVEVIECYYNAEIKNNIIKNLKLKNGKIGLAPFSNSYFVSLSTSEIITSYNLFDNVSKYSDSQQYLNMNPLQMSLKMLKKAYSLKLLSISGSSKNIYHIEFTRKIEPASLFSGEIWIDNSNFNLLKIKLIKNANDKTLSYQPFSTIKPSHKIDSISLSLIYTFANDSSISKLDYIQINYCFKYTDDLSSKNISSNGIIYLFDKEELFFEPKFSYNNAYADYDKILSFPYNQWFWDHNDAIQLSEKKKNYVDFFAKNGVLLSYSDLNSNDNSLFIVKKQTWSASSRITVKSLNKKYNFSLNSNKFKNDDHSSVPYNLFDLKGQLFLDINKFNDSISYITASIIDLDESYYYLQEQSYTNYFINIYFDLIEIQRLKLNDELSKCQKTVNAMEIVYESNVKELEAVHERYLKEVQRGINQKKLEQWNAFVFEKLHIDNSSLSNDSIRGVRARSTIENNQELSDIESYNAGTAFFILGQYELAKTYFLEAISTNNTNSWYYYNLGLTYYKLNDLKNACINLNICISKGEKIEESLLRLICNQ
ncbi:MAG: carboxypeptidase-like regulatory domain-containing protein [Bacteroidota bacterium]